MRFCLISCVLAAAVNMESAPVDTPPSRATVVIRADNKSGRLIRSVAVPSRPVPSRDVTPQSPAAPDKETNVAALVDKTAREQGVDPLLVHSIIQVESGYNQYAISHRGAEGLMQLFPPTARTLGVSNSFDAEQNIRAGVKHLKQLQERFKDDRLALAAYNAGEGAVTRFRGIPPYAETQDYVIKVGRTLGNARRKAKAAAPTPPEPSKPEFAPVEHYVDEQGRLHLRTR